MGKGGLGGGIRREFLRGRRAGLGFRHACFVRIPVRAVIRRCLRDGEACLFCFQAWREGVQACLFPNRACLFSTPRRLFTREARIFIDQAGGASAPRGGLGVSS